MSSPDSGLGAAATKSPGAVLPQECRADGAQIVANAELARQLEEAAELRRTLLAQIESLRKTEAELRASEHRYRGVFESAPDSLFLISADPAAGGRILDANDLAATVHGYTRAELLQMKIGELDSPGCAERVPERIARLLGGEKILFEVIHRRKDGSEFPVEVTASVVEFDGRPCILSFNRDITERRRAQAAEAREKRRLRGILAASPVPTAINDAQGRITFLNDAFTEAYGYTAEDIPTLEAWWLRAYPTADDRSRVKQRWVAVAERAELTGNAFVPLEMKVGCKDGSSKWVLASCAEFDGPDAGGQVIKLVDLSVLKRREEEQRALTQRLDLAIQAGEFGTFHRDLITGRAVWNQRAFEIFGLKPQSEGPSQAEILAAVVPEDRASVGQTWEAALDRKWASSRLEFRIRLPGGGTRTIVRRKTVQTDEDGRAVAVFGVYEDVTAIRANERDRLAFLQRYDTIFNALAEGLTLQIANDAVLDCNPAAERILGLTRRQLLGLDPIDPKWRTVDDRGQPLAATDHPAMVAARIGHSVRNFVMGVHRGDGSLVWLSVNAEPVREATRGVLQVITSFVDITAQRLAETAQRRAEARLHVAVAAAQMVWWEWQIVAGDFSVKSYGPACILGYSNLQMAGYTTGQAWLEKTHPEDRPEVARMLQEALAGRLDNWQCEHRLLAADGSWRWVRNLGRVTERSADGAPLVMLGTTQDVHEQYKAKVLAQTNAERLRIALDASAMGVWVYNLQTGEADWDKRECELFGLAPDQGAPTMEAFLAMVEPADRGAIEAAWAGLDAEHPNFEYRFRLNRNDHRIRHIRCVGTLGFDAAGRAEWATGINEDITDEQEKNIALSELNDRLQLALRASHLGVWEVDLRTQKVQWDDALLSIYGLERSEHEGSVEQFYGLVNPEDREHLRALDLKGGPRENAALRQFRILRRSDGAERFIEAHSYVVRDTGGVPVRVLGLDRDVTEQKNAEAKQRQLEARLFQSQKLETLGTLAGGIAHDFNNLLTGMLGFVELSQQSLPPGHEVVGFLGHVRDGGLRARDLVKRLLLFARKAPESARGAIRLEALVVDTLPLLSALLPASIQITTQLAHVAGCVLADSGQLQQVVMNLVVNASQAIGPEHGKISIGVRGVELVGGYEWELPSGAYLCLEVTDNGPGMDAATRARIFDPFFTTKALGEGTGLGLAIVHGIVADHGGAIRVRSAPGEGATFEILLPVVPEASESMLVAATAAQVLAGAGMKVLLVDDEESVRRLAEFALKRAGFTVDTCADGLSAVRQFSAAPSSYTVALLDLSMPGRTGIELIGDLRAIRADLPVLLMSGDHSRIRHAAGSGVSFTRLAKPFLIAEFFAALKRVIDEGRPESR